MSLDLIVDSVNLRRISKQFWFLVPNVIQTKTSQTHILPSLWVSDHEIKSRGNATVYLEWVVWGTASGTASKWRQISPHKIDDSTLQYCFRKIYVHNINHFLSLLVPKPEYCGQTVITGINPEAVKWGVDRYDRLLCPGLQPGPPSQTPGGLGQRYWSVREVTWPPQLELRRWRSSEPSSVMNVSWFLESPANQRPWYWLLSINGSLSSIKSDFDGLRHFCVEKYKENIFLCFTLCGTNRITLNTILAVNTVFLELPLFLCFITSSPIPIMLTMIPFHAEHLK